MVHASARSRRLVTRRAEDQMLAQVKIQRGSLGALNQSTGVVGGLSGLSLIYQGKARIWNVEGSGVLSVGNGTIDTRSTFVSIPSATTPVPRRDDIVTVLNDDLADTDLDARVFRVMEVDGGGYLSDTRKLTCSSFYQSRWWSD